jgi:caa(3)-type oxidase subunit IV
MHATISLRSLGIALVVLLGLTILSWGLSRFALGAAGTPIALAIAAGKALVVAIAFMELLGASLPARVIALVTITFIALLCAGTVTDIALR